MRLFAGLSVAFASFLFATGVAMANGKLLVQHANGKTDTYNNVAIKVVHGALYVTSSDGKGTIVIHRAACSYQSKLLVCLPTSVTLVQAGKIQPLDLKIGTVYLNDTDAPQPLVLSSAKVPPHSVLLSFTTHRGTYVSLNGRIDQVVK